MHLKQTKRHIIPKPSIQAYFIHSSIVIMALTKHTHPSYQAINVNQTNACIYTYMHDLPYLALCITSSMYQCMFMFICMFMAFNQS